MVRCVNTKSLSASRVRILIIRTLYSPVQVPRPLKLCETSKHQSLRVRYPGERKDATYACIILCKAPKDVKIQSTVVCGDGDSACPIIILSS